MLMLCRESKKKLEDTLTSGYTPSSSYGSSPDRVVNIGANLPFPCGIVDDESIAWHKSQLRQHTSGPTRDWHPVYSLHFLLLVGQLEKLFRQFALLGDFPYVVPLSDDPTSMTVLEAWSIQANERFQFFFALGIGGGGELFPPLRDLFLAGDSKSYFLGGVCGS